DAYPNETITQPVTRIDFVSHTTSNGGVAFNVETQLPSNADEKYRIGMNANATIILSTKENVLSLPLSSIDDSGYVWLKVAQGYKKVKPILGEENDTDVEVLGGVAAGDVIALDPQAASRQAVK
ncbi:MAG: efflux RND transporter periplasmic adaptor subunit, partial [Patescibacteria group bacterium]|nr:efflux RND transporter periplasmic adaptor subunit [Patescibacteria group bacterium]